MPQNNGGRVLDGSQIHILIDLKHTLGQLVEFCGKFLILETRKAIIPHNGIENRRKIGKFHRKCAKEAFLSQEMAKMLKSGKNSPRFGGKCKKRGAVVPFEG